MTDGEARVHLGVDRGIATITLDSPHNRNALSTPLVNRLGEHLRTALDDDGVRAVVLTATGTTFCAGADLSSASDEPPTVSFPEILTTVWESPKPVVVALNGHVRAGGIGLVAACDLVVAPPEASFAFTEVRIGVAPAMIAVFCARKMDPVSLRRYLLTGERFDAATAARAGLVTVVADDVAAATEELVSSFRATEPHAVAVTRELIRTLPTMSVADGLAHASEISAELFRSDAAREGIASFREKRAPNWAID